MKQRQQFTMTQSAKGVTTKLSVDADMGLNVRPITEKGKQFLEWTTEQGQQKLDFDSIFRIPVNRIVCDKPEAGKPLSFRVECDKLDEQEKATIFNYSETKAKLELRFVPLKADKKGKAAHDTSEKKEPDKFAEPKTAKPNGDAKKASANAKPSGRGVVGVDIDGKGNPLKKFKLTDKSKSPKAASKPVGKAGF